MKTDENERKSKGSRGAVLQAAYDVFSQHPYNAASIRAIAKQGGFPHTLISYYYPTKAQLFQAVTTRICEDLFCANVAWLEQVRGIELEKGFNMYVWQVIEYHRIKPWVFRILMLNLVQGAKGVIPGHDRLVSVIDEMRSSFEKIMHPVASKAEIWRFTDSFNAMSLYYLGASDSAAWLLRMDPDSYEYGNWVQYTLVSIFLPMLKKLHGKN